MTETYEAYCSLILSLFESADDSETLDSGLGALNEKSISPTRFVTCLENC